MVRWLSRGRRRGRGSARRRPGRPRARGRDDHDRVVPGDGAEHRRQVRRGRWRRRGTSRPRAACAGRRGCADGSAVTSSSSHSRAQPGASPRRPSWAGRAARSPPSPGTAYTRARPERTFTAPSSTRSRDSVACVTSMPSLGEQVEQLGLRAHRVPAAGSRRSGAGGRVRAGRDGHRGRLRSSRQDEQGLLGVQPVLGLVPDHRLRAVDDLGGDLQAPVGGQAVQDDRVGGGAGHEGGGRPAKGTNGLRRPGRRAFCASCPIDTQVSVATTSAPATAASAASVVTVTDPPCSRRDRRRPGEDRRRRAGGSAGRADPHVHAGEGAAEQVGVGHVVGAVADVGEGQARPGRPCARGRSAGRRGSGRGGTRRSGR